MPLRQFVVSTRDANNTYTATTVEGTPYQLTKLKATCTAGPVQAIQALLAKATPPLKLVRIVSKADLHNADGHRTGITHHLIETEES